MALERRLQVARYVSLAAATVIALACGTNVSVVNTRFSIAGADDILQYAYSAWGPQFAEDMNLSSTQSNMIVCLLSLPIDCDSHKLLVNLRQLGHVLVWDTVRETR